MSSLQEGLEVLRIRVPPSEERLDVGLDRRLQRREQLLQAPFFGRAIKRFSQLRLGHGRSPPYPRNRPIGACSIPPVRQIPHFHVVHPSGNRAHGAFSLRDILSLFPLGSTLPRQHRPRRRGACGARNAAGRPAADQGDAGTAERSALRPLELDLRPLVVENRAQLGILRGGEIALRLQDEEVRRQADLELALLRLELSFGQLPRRRRGLDPVTDRLDAKRGVGDLAGDPLILRYEQSRKQVLSEDRTYRILKFAE